MSEALLRITGVHAELAKVHVLRAVDLAVPVGDVVAVVGRNGAGKTTLLRLVMGFVPVRAGTVAFEGRDLARVPARARARLGIGYAPEDRGLFPTFTVEENLRFPCEVGRVDAAQTRRRLDAACEIVPQLGALLPRSAAGLSGGQGKMVALGRAIMAGTRLVLLDEPFQGLAPALAQQYAEALRRLRQWRPEAAVVVTESNRALLRDVPTATVVLERGSVLATPTSHGVH